jgi:hypothetical protein
VKILHPFRTFSIDEVIVKFKGRLVFKPYIPQKRKGYVIKMFKLCDSTGYTTYKTSFCLSSMQRVEASTIMLVEERVYLQNVLETCLLHYAIRKL